MRKLIAISVVGAVGAALLLIAGCGGGGEDGANAQQIGKAAFVKQANTICEQASGRMAAKFQLITQRKSGRTFTQTQIFLIRELLAPGLEEELRKIQALGSPKGAKREAEDFLREYRKAIDQTKTKAKAIVENKAPEPEEAVSLAARRIGISACPVSPVTGG